MPQLDKYNPTFKHAHDSLIQRDFVDDILGEKYLMPPRDDICFLSRMKQNKRAMGDSHLIRLK